MLESTKRRGVAAMRCCWSGWSWSWSTENPKRISCSTRVQHNDQVTSIHVFALCARALCLPLLSFCCFSLNLFLSRAFSFSLLPLLSSYLLHSFVVYLHLHCLHHRHLHRRNLHTWKTSFLCTLHVECPGVSQARLLQRATTPAVR
jgi:hypothetical protein